MQTATKKGKTYQRYSMRWDSQKSNLYENNHLKINGAWPFVQSQQAHVLLLPGGSYCIFPNYKLNHKWKRTRIGTTLRWSFCVKYFSKYCLTSLYQPFLKKVNTLRPRQRGRHFPDHIFKCIFLNENVWISLKIRWHIVDISVMVKFPKCRLILIQCLLMIRLKVDNKVHCVPWVVPPFEIWLSCLPVCSVIVMVQIPAVCATCLHNN